MSKLCSNKDCRSVLPEGRSDHRCADCKRAYSAKWRASRVDKMREYYAKVYSENREARLDTQARYNASHKRERRVWESDYRLRTPEKGRVKKCRRRARLKGCTVGFVDERLVVEKAGGLCQLCGILVPENLREIDHIIPLAKGGPHTQDNLQLLCRTCNRRKGANILGTCLDADAPPEGEEDDDEVDDE